MGLWIVAYQPDKDGWGRPEGREEQIQQWVTPGYHYLLRCYTIQGALLNGAQNTLVITLYNNSLYNNSCLITNMSCTWTQNFQAVSVICHESFAVFFFSFRLLAFVSLVWSGRVEVGKRWCHTFLRTSQDLAIFEIVDFDIKMRWLLWWGEVCLWCQTAVD